VQFEIWGCYVSEVFGHEDGNWDGLDILRLLILL